MCGVFGIHAPGRDVARLSYFGLFALQHRGQESAGIAVSDAGRVTALRDMGLVTQVFSEQKLRGLRGQIAIGHSRYSTTGSTHWANAQPIVHHGPARTVALAHNGNLTNTGELRAELLRSGARLSSTSDTEQQPRSPLPPHSFMVTPTTWCPASASRAAARDESTPPDMATSTRRGARSWTGTPTPPAGAAKRIRTQRPAAPETAQLGFTLRRNRKFLEGTNGEFRRPRADFSLFLFHCRYGE